MDFDRILSFAVQNGASDVHLQAGSPPMLRVAGQLRQVNADAIDADAILAFLAGIHTDGIVDALDGMLSRGLDFSYFIPAVARFRCSAYKHLGLPAMVTRVIRKEIPTIESLNLPPVLKDIAMSQRGLTLVTGTTGSGKSSTLAAMIDLINASLHMKIITIEDPIEYVYENKKSMISQLEVGTDTPSFDQAMRQAMRQDPDVILVGELRDVETLRAALRAADTGHQVFSTIHSATAPQTVERIIAMFPPAEHKLLLSQLAGAIEAIISQRLVAGHEGQRYPAVEILRGDAVSQKMILENEIVALADYISGGEAGMQSFDQNLLKLYEAQKISGKEAMHAATNPEAMAMAMRGIRGAGIKRS
jgi:twitching motility protein PilT